MKYCKTCGVLYTTDVCPKCGVTEPPKEEPQDMPSAKETRNRWIALLIAIPASILLIMGIVTLYFKLIH